MFPIAFLNGYGFLQPLVKRAIGSHNPLNTLLGINYSAFNGDIIGLVLQYQA